MRVQKGCELLLAVQGLARRRPKCTSFRPFVLGLHRELGRAISGVGLRKGPPPGSGLTPVRLHDTRARVPHHQNQYVQSDSRNGVLRLVIR